MEYLQGLLTLTQSCAACGTEVSRSTNPVSLIEDGLFILSAQVFTERLNLVYQEMGISDMEAGILDDDSGVLKALILKGRIEYASIIFNTPNQDPNSQEPVMQMNPEQANEPIICQVAVLVNFPEIARQQGSSESFSSEEDHEDYLITSLLELQSNRDAIFRDTAVPILKAWYPSLTDAEIEETLSLFHENEQTREDTCGQLSVQHINGFLIMLCHIFAISSSPDFWAMLVT